MKQLKNSIPLLVVFFVFGAIFYFGGIASTRINSHTTTTSDTTECISDSCVGLA